jgi:hypothetical protein
VQDALHADSPSLSSGYDFCSSLDYKKKSTWKPIRPSLPKRSLEVSMIYLSLNLSQLKIIAEWSYI